MREETRKLFKFLELSEEARKKALNQYEPFDYPWSRENEKSLDAFCDAFGVKVSEWDANRGDISWSFTGGPWTERSGIRLYNWLMYHYFDTLYPMEYLNGKRERTWRRIPANCGCFFTGYCFDDILMDPIMEFLEKPTERKDWEGLVNDCLYAWIFAFREEIEYTWTDESKEENIIANEYEFLENGTRV
jgi:hypothetical protein